MNPPKGVDLKFTSFAKRPAFQGLGLGKGFGKKKQEPRYRPGGDWAEDPKESNDMQFGDVQPEVPKLKGEVQFMEEIEPPSWEPEKPEKKTTSKASKGSKFGFIKKKKESSIKAKFGAKKKSKEGLFSLSDLKHEKYGYPKKMVQEIVEPIGARKKPSDAILQKFLKQTSNFDPRIVLSVLYHLLEDPEVEWLSKYRSLLALERLMVKNPDYSQAARKLGSQYQPMLQTVFEGYQFEQKSHERLVKKANEAVLKLFEGSDTQTDETANKGFDFNKMNEMMKQVGKKKKNPGFLSAMSKVKQKSKKNNSSSTGQKLNDQMDLLDLNVGAQANSNQDTGITNDQDLFGFGDFGGSNGNGNDLGVNQNVNKNGNHIEMKAETNDQNGGFDLDLFGGGGTGFQNNNNNNNNPVSNNEVPNLGTEVSQKNSSGGGDLFDLDFGVGSGAQNQNSFGGQNKPKAKKIEASTPNYDDMDFL